MLNKVEKRNGILKRDMKDFKKSNFHKNTLGKTNIKLVQNKLVNFEGMATETIQK